MDSLVSGRVPDQLLFADQAIKGCDECPDPAGGVKDSCADTRTLFEGAAISLPFSSQPNPEGSGARPPASLAEDADCTFVLLLGFTHDLFSFPTVIISFRNTQLILFFISIPQYLMRFSLIIIHQVGPRNTFS